MSEPPADDGASVDVAAAHRSRQLDEDALDAIAERLDLLPEPLAALALSVEVARAEGDATGIRKRLFELGVAVVRHAVAVGLAVVAASDQAPPAGLVKAIRGAGRMSDGQWCALARKVGEAVKAVEPGLASAWKFTRGRPLAALVEARNAFVHGGGRGDDAPALVLAVLERAESLVEPTLRHVVAPGSVQERHGTPLRPGVWRKRKHATPDAAVAGEAYLEWDDRWIAATPWIPSADGKLLLLDAPKVRGGAFRAVDPDTGLHQPAPATEEAVRALVGGADDAPVGASDRPTLVARAAALANLRRAAAHVVDEKAIAVVALTGPQGMGCSRLLDEVAEAAPGLGFGRVLVSACHEHRRGVLRPLRRAIPEDDPAFEPLSEALARAGRGDAVAGSAGLEAAVEAVEEALLRLSADAPVAWVIDDAQWADPSTLELCAWLTERATRRAAGRLLVVVAVRDEPGAPSALRRLLGLVERDVGIAATRVTLEPLSEAEATALVQAVAPVAPEVADALVQRAGGVPYFLTQALQTWIEMGALSWREGAWRPTSPEVLTQPVPGIAQLVDARLESLFEPGSPLKRVALRALLLCGVADDALRLDTLRAAVEKGGGDVDRLDDALEALVDSHLLASRPGGNEVGVAQPMVGEAVVAVYGAKPWAARVRSGLLDVLAGGPRADEDAVFLAREYEVIGNAAQSIAFRDRAVRYALARGLFDEAEQQARRLAVQRAASGDPAGKLDALLSAVDAALRGGRAKEAAGELEKMAALGSVQEVRRALLTIACGHALGEALPIDDDLVARADAASLELGVEARLAWARQTRGEEGIARVEEAIARLTPESAADLRYRAMVLRCELIEAIASLADARGRAALVAARAAAEASGSAWALLDAENDWAIYESARGDHAAAIELLLDVRTKAAAVGFGALTRGALVNLAAVAARARRFEDAARWGDEAATAARDAGQPGYVGMARSIQAEAHEGLGDLDRARTLIGEAIDVKRRAGASTVIALLRQASILEAARELEGARDALERARDEAHDAGQPDHVARTRLRLALFDWDRGDTAPLRRAVADLADRRDSLRAPTLRCLEEGEQRVAAP